MEAAAGLSRFRKSHPCPICGGGDDMPRGKGQRCSGYLSSDGRFAYCTREEFAGQAALEQTEPPSYRHILEGECRCGATHLPAAPKDEIAYDYVNADSKLVYQVVRGQNKKFTQRRPDGAGGWIWNLKGVEPVLYRLPRVLETATVGETVYVVEGEKDVHAVEQAGGVATCNSGGAGKWRSSYAEALQGATVIIVADNDEPGLAHAHQVAETLPAVSTSIVLAATGKDVSDHLNAGHTLDELEPLSPDEQPQAPEPIIFETLRLFFQRELPESEALIGVSREGTNLLPRYGWVMPWGREGSGKTSVLIDMLYHAASGHNWLGYTITRPLRIVAIINEGVPGGLQDKLRQKLEHWDGPEDPILDNIALYSSPWGEFTFSDQRKRDHARDYALDFQADYVAADPLHTLGTTGAGTPQETEEFKHLLRNFGLWQDLGILTAHHSNKNGMVSGDWARHPDTVIRLEKDGRNPATKFTLEKARPADPAELGVPQLLEWITDTLGYRRIQIDTEPIGDTELIEAIHDAVTNAAKVGPGHITLTELKLAVTGDSKRIATLTRGEIEAGRLTNRAFRKDWLWIAPGRTETQYTQSNDNDAQTRIDTENRLGEDAHPVAPSEDFPVTEEATEWVPPRPLKGAPSQSVTQSPGDPDADIPF